MPSPPRWPLRMMRLLLKAEYLEEIEGDLEELYWENIKTYSPKRAARQYAWDSLKLLRPRLLRHLSVSYSTPNFAMFQHHMLIALRSFQRHRTSFLINLIGLSTGLAGTLLIGLWVYDEWQMDQFHANEGRLYQILERVDQDGGIITRETTSGPMAADLVERMPEVERAITGITISPGNSLLSVGDKDIHQSGIWAGEDFFHLFSFPLVEGNKEQVLRDPSSVVISERLAKKLFGRSQQIVGEMIEWEHDTLFQVSGVFADIPTNSSLQFEWIRPFESFRLENSWVNRWGNTMPQTYVLLKEGADIAQVNAKLDTWIIEKSNGDVAHRRPFAAPFHERYLYSRYENGQQAGGRIEYVHLFSLIALFILFIACINFMNLATARASQRAREVGIKKTIGAHRSTLVMQFLSESVLMALAALALAVCLVQMLLPEFNAITGKQLELALTGTWGLTLVGVVIITGLLAGSYPALYLSRFRPINVLKGAFSQQQGHPFVRQGLVVFQFALSLILIIAVGVVQRQITFVQTQNLGYNKDNIVIMGPEGALQEEGTMRTFMQELERIPGVKDMARSGHDFTGHNGGSYGIVWPGKDPENKTEFERMAVGANLLSLMDIKMREGRNFRSGHPKDSMAVIFNQAAIDFMGLTPPIIGQKVEVWEEEAEIIGITENFHFDSFRERVKPVFIFLSKTLVWHVMIKLAEGQESETLEQIDALHARLNPGFDFGYRFLDDDFQELYTSEQRVATLSRYFAGLAILISCLGLFGLAAFTAERRRKEISIRKILGASTLRLWQILSADFAKLVVVASLLAFPVAYWLLSEWLQGFAYRIQPPWWLALAALGITLVISLLVVSWHTLRAAHANPAEALRAE